MHDRTYKAIQDLIKSIQAAEHRRFPQHLYCIDCLKPSESFMLERQVWFAAMEKGEGACCIACVEKRLGRDLHYTDFRPSPNNLAIFRGMIMGAA